MNPAEARQLLGLEEGAGDSEIQAAYEQRREEIEGRIATAPTAALKGKYVAERERLARALESLQGAPSLPGGSENLPVLIGDEEATPKVALSSMQDREEKGGSRFFAFLGAWGPKLVMIAAAVGAGYYVYLTTNQDAAPEPPKLAESAKPARESKPPPPQTEPVQGDVLLVPKNFLTITEALAAAKPGQTVLVKPKPDGEPYEESVRIEKERITLMGDAGVVLRGRGTHQPVLEIYDARGVTVTNLEFEQTTESVGRQEYPVGRIGSSDEVALNNCQFRNGGGHGLEISGGAVHATDCGFQTNQHGVKIYAGARAEFKNCHASGNAASGFFVEETGTRVTLTECVAKGNGEFGIHSLAGPRARRQKTVINSCTF